MASLARRITRLRRKAGLSQAQLAARCSGLTRAAVYNWENGLNNPSVAHLGLIARALGVDVSELFR